MNVIRSAFLWAFMFLTIALMGPVHIFCGLFIDRTGALSYRIATAYLRLCCLYIGMKIRIVGAEHVPREGSFIVMPNHRSWWDIPAVQLAIYPRQLRFIYKKQLENLPILGWCIKVGGHIGIDREDRERAVRVLRDVARRFSGHFSLVIFPEGTRSPGRHLQRFKRGGFHLSRELELPVIPVSISGSQVIQSRHTMTFHPGTVTITFHPAVSAADFASLDAMIAHVRAQVFAGLTDGAPEPAPAPAQNSRGSNRAVGPTVALLLAFGLGAVGLIGGMSVAQGFGGAPPPSPYDSGVRAADPDSLAALLKLEGEDPHDFVVDPVGQSLAPLPRFSAPALTDAARLSPLRAPLLLREWAVEALEASGRASALVAAAARAQDHPVDEPADRRGLARAGEGTAEGPGTLFDAIAGFYSDGKRLDGKKRDDLRRMVATVPALVSWGAAGLIHGLHTAIAARERAFKRVSLGSNILGKGGFAEVAQTWVDSLAVGPPETAQRRVAAAAEATDFSALNAGATELLRAIETYADVDDPGPDFSFAWDSPYGRIAINRHGDDHYAGDYLLILDLDGNDTYLGGGRTTAVAPVSVIVDIQGNDRYVPADSASAGPGGAIAGYAIVDDRGGDDHYRAWRVGLGAGVFGVGCLIDRAGSDTLEAYTASEGAGFFGLGVLADAGGDDVYRVAQSGQGCGGSGGVGWLVDAQGQDSYEALDAPVPAGPWVSDPLSLAQGCAFGLSEGGMPWPGGCGMLVDFQGNDRYSAGDVAQGYGESRGIGALVDLRGDDVRRVGIGGLGVGRDLGVGLCYDGGGRDEYISAGELTLGAATSLGLGLCVDDAGDDTYTLPENGLGCATGPGLALFVEGGGDDRYVVAEPGGAFGHAARVSFGERSLERTLVRRAAFFDLAGRDIYPESWNERPPRNSGAWWGSVDVDRDWRVHGLGLDRP